MKKEEKLMNKPNDVIKTMITQFCGNIDRLVMMLGTKQLVYDNATAIIKFDFKMCRKATLFMRWSFISLIAKKGRCYGNCQNF